MEISMETDWGAKGAQLTGEQVQAFIKKSFIELQDKDTELSEEVGRLKDANDREDTQIASLSTDVDSLGTRLSATEQKTVDEAAKVEALAIQQTDLSERLLSLETGINRDEVNGAVSKIDTLFSKDDELEGRIDTLAQQNTSMQNQIASMQRDNGTFQTQLTSLSSSIESAKSSMQPLGCEKITSLSLVPVEKNLYIAEVDANQSFSLKSVPAAGREVHVIVRNTGAERITVLLPTNGGYCSDVETFHVEAGKNGEINAVSDGEKIYIRSI